MTSPADLWGLEPEVLFLNHGSFGACPTSLLARQQALRDELEREPIDFLARTLPERMDYARMRLASFVHADPEGLAFVANTTTGVNTVLRSLRFDAKDQILVTNHGYPACTNAARVVAEAVGAEVVTAHVPFPLKHRDEVVQAILASVTDRTRLALIDHITSPTGLVFPIEEIVRTLDSRGIDTLVDGAHAPGMVSLHVDAIGAAYYAGNGHKWMCAPKGAAFLHVRRDRRTLIRPLVISHGATAATGERSRYRLEFDWTGTVDPTPWLTLPAAIDFLDRLVDGGFASLCTRLRSRTLEARRFLLGRLNEAPPCPSEMIAALATIPLPKAPAGESPDHQNQYAMQRWLRVRQRIEVPVFAWPKPPARCLRIAGHLYTPRDAHHRLMQALETGFDMERRGQPLQ